ncbi:hypothetical protein [Enterococcus malodoratus]|uniref:ABC transporter substrate-binding protein n=1 Tax=Enterococcus malodoratus ATCC 43197 TaxID=1158601 RepID=R2QUS8_9ENTE|nr:hypothetical protein [Enterococcus malodoratus]EOH75255.1 hypothetical protein UAI_03057 [Enterococcus malodoratus ATCC 43197]EOT66717.1 hypothetical protein I585_02238 [Enterococcus malodoratus ATCC 43197]OJG65988.1 hypothetical protein RV07_GL001575 [Enterococcus malodoratus]SPW90739.1 Uncharacterised protein [Enterococcus malodoratus]STD70030.1 Uncharacterised protein [Enterococcus malodoratus]
MKKMATRGIAAALLLLVVGGLAGCGNDKEAAESDEKNLTIGVTSFADTLEPTEQYFGWVVSRYGLGKTWFDLIRTGKSNPV